MKNRFYLPLIACLLAGIVVWTAHAQEQRHAPVRPAWDYKICLYVTGAIRGGEVPPDEFYEDGKKAVLPPGGPLARLKELGDEGWELCQVEPRFFDWARWENRYYLKRAK